jgi:hypothetical protein
MVRFGALSLQFDPLAGKFWYGTRIIPTLSQLWLYFCLVCLFRTAESRLGDRSNGCHCEWIRLPAGSITTFDEHLAIDPQAGATSRLVCCILLQLRAVDDDRDIATADDFNFTLTRSSRLVTGGDYGLGNFSRRNRSARESIHATLLAVGAVSIKLTALPLLLVTGLWFLFRAGFDRQVIQRIGIAAVVSLWLIPLLLSSIVTSGCPLYPSSTFCLDLPWAIGANKSLVQPLGTKVANATHHWISWYGTPPAGVNPWLWAFQLWFQKSGNKFIVAMMAISAGCSLYLLNTRASIVNRLGSMWIITITVAGIGFFLLTSPLSRFMMPYLFMVPALALATYDRDRFDATGSLAQPRWRTKIFDKLPINQTKIVTIVLVSIAAIATVTQVRSNYSLLILPPPLDRIATVKRQVNDVTYFLPVGGENKGCWTIELPCAYTPAQMRLRHPNEGIKAGFIRN